MGNSRDYIVPFSVRGGNGAIVTNYFAVRKYSFLGNQEEEEEEKVTREANVERKFPPRSREVLSQGFPRRLARIK